MPESTRFLGLTLDQTSLGDAELIEGGAAQAVRPAERDGLPNVFGGRCGVLRVALCHLEQTAPGGACELGGVEIANPVNAAHIRDTGIPPGPPGRRSYEVKAACYAGTWRVSMSVTGSIQGQPFVFSNY